MFILKDLFVIKYDLHPHIHLITITLRSFCVLFVPRDSSKAIAQAYYQVISFIDMQQASDPIKEPKKDAKKDTTIPNESKSSRRSMLDLSEDDNLAQLSVAVMEPSTGSLAIRSP